MIKAMLARLNATNSDRQQQPTPTRPNVNPNQLINPYYMRQPDTDSFAPMLAYQQYLRNGVFPQESPSQFTPMSQQQQQPGSQPAPTSTQAATTSQRGGK